MKITMRTALLVLTAVSTLTGLTGCVVGVSEAGTTDAVVIAATATANEPAPSLSAADLQLLNSVAQHSSNGIAFVVSPAGGQSARLPLTPRRTDGQIEYGPRRPQLLSDNIRRVQDRLRAEAAGGRFDLLDTILAASRVTPAPATMVLLSSGVSTAGGFDLRQVGWAEPPAAAAAALKSRGLLPDLNGWTIIFSGLGQTSGRQPALPLPQQTTLAAYWLAICHAAGATACRVDESPRRLSPSRSTVPVPVVPVPAVQSITGPHQQKKSIVPADLLFRFASSTLVPAANSYLSPIAEQEIHGHYFVSITGEASPDGGSAAYNDRLSALRARAVQDRLVTLGVPSSKIIRVRGVGTDHQTCTVHGTLDESRCAQLRRVVIVLAATAAATS
jgi:outer membrane protein OmpA-like peptidoglycan-associated protein